MTRHLPTRRFHSTERRALTLAVLLSGAGIGVAAYLLRLHLAIAGDPHRGFCTFTYTLSCDAVLASPYAEIVGLPVALLGLVGFAVLCGLAAWRLWMPARSPRPLPTLLVLAAGAGLCFELRMTWIEVFVIQALCPYCLTALGLIAGTFLATLWARRVGQHVEAGDD
jgi:uncharacterized membrane protein